MSPGSREAGHDRPQGPGWDDLIARRPRRAGGARDRVLSRVVYDPPAASPVSPADVPGRAGEDWPEGEYACVGVRFTARLEPPPRGHRHVAVYLRVGLDDRRAAVVDLRAAGGADAGPRVTASGLGGAAFGWLFGDVAGWEEVAGTFAAYALLRVPSGTDRLTGELRVHSSVRRRVLWRPRGGAVEHVRTRSPWRFTVPVPPLVTVGAGPAAVHDVLPGRGTDGGAARAARGVPSRGGAGETRVRLCLAADMERFSRFRNPEAVRAQARLADALARAREHAGLDEQDVDLQLSGDGQFAVFPERLDETVVIPRLVEGLRQALADVNADLSEHARVRLRVAVHRGLTTPAGNGWVGEATIAVRRILDSSAAREALGRHPEADFVLIVPDALYRDVIGHGYGRLRPETFHQVEATLPEKGFTERAWIHVPAS